MRTKKEILQDEKDLIQYNSHSDTIHTELLLDIRQLLIKFAKRGLNDGA